MIQFDPKLPRHDWVENMKYIDRTESKSEMIFTLDCAAVYSLELVSKELNHLAAILHVYAGGLNFMK